jgi:hypothetical protein
MGGHTYHEVFCSAFFPAVGGVGGDCDLMEIPCFFAGMAEDSEYKNHLGYGRDVGH